MPDDLSRCITEEPITDKDGDDLHGLGGDIILITTRSGANLTQEENDERVDEEDALDDARVKLNLGMDAGELPVQITREEMLVAQGADNFCREFLVRQVTEGHEGAESPDGLLLKVNDEEGKKTILVLEFMRARLLNLIHCTRLSGNP